MISKQANHQSFLFFIVIMLVTMQNFNSQNVYPRIQSMPITVSTMQSRSQVGAVLTYTTPFEIKSPPTCIHTLNGLDFSTVNLATDSGFKINSSILLCSNTKMALKVEPHVFYLSKILFYVLAISNDQSSSYMTFSIIQVIDGKPQGPVWKANENPRQFLLYPTRQYKISQNYSLNGLYKSDSSTKFIAYPCISILEINTVGLMKFDVYSNYFSDINLLETKISVYNFTFVFNITIKVILFNEIRSKTQNNINTYYGDIEYINKQINSTDDFNINVANFNNHYFSVFIGFRGLSLNFSNIQKRGVNGQTDKNFSMQSTNYSTLKFISNFMKDYESFKNCHILYYYLVITKYKQKINYTSQTPYSNIEQKDNIMLINIIAIAIVVISIVIYKKLYLPRRFTGNSLTLQNGQQIGSSTYDL